jgi:hypothetical protein
MEEGVDAGEVIIRPGKRRFVQIVCRHVRRNPAWQTHEFPNRLVIRQSITGRLVEVGAEFLVDAPFPAGTYSGPQRVIGVPGPRWVRDGPVEALVTYRYKCPQCRCDLQLRSAGMLRLIGALDSMERRRTGKQASRVHRLDISSADQVLAFLRQVGRAP